MLVSTETRWILSSDQVNIIEKWFSNYNEYFEESNLFQRQDYYLKTNSTELGIKLREPKKDEKGEVIAKLEAKKLLEDYGAKKFSNGNNGNVNSWVKFSFDTDPQKNPLDLIIGNSSNMLSSEWIKIEKDRLLVKYDAENERIVSGKEMIGSGSGIELTKYKLNNNVYYSLGIESFSDKKGNTNEVFYQTMNFLFTDIKISGLEYTNSKSYPEILLQKP
ncbi:MULTISPECIES: hypothetical protein [Flavobacterium]|uniref:Uncharacterized protein n=1 Tax=Flavobacterium hankyongi TaxID=1176532 RepID=A0ABP9A980_9FLAO|nr:hypothetical protein [Flavobacterium sp. N1846]